MLGWLQKKAWSEIRFGVFSTVGVIFPAELTEQIFENALCAEAIPTDPGVEERSPERIARIQAEPSTPTRQTGRSSIRLNERVIKQIYSCDHIRHKERMEDVESDWALLVSPFEEG